MKKQTVIQYFGGITATAKALRISPQAVFLWGDEVPSLRAYQIEVITKGALTISRETPAAIDGNTKSDEQQSLFS